MHVFYGYVFMYCCGRFGPWVWNKSLMMIKKCIQLSSRLSYCLVSDRRTWRSVQSSPWRETCLRPRLQRPLSPIWICLRLALTANRSWWTGRLFTRGRATLTSSAPLPAFWNVTKWNKLRRPVTSAFSESYSSLFHLLINAIFIATFLPFLWEISMN